MLRRCCNKDFKHFHHYGGRGIAVCDRWKLFEAFLSDMGECPLGLTLDRIKNDGDYKPGNCRWATQAEQNRNKRTNRLITWNGETLPLVDWAKRCGVCAQTIHYRILRDWPLGEALSTPSLHRATA
jgi:hypothetical protein